jgi:RNA polymerase sigma-70 factor (ECF subfamily)
MGTSQDPSTRATLLGRLYRGGATDEEAWREFVVLYGSHIYKWCRFWQLQDDDAQEVTQKVLVQLLAKMKEFVYDPSRSFRAWLKTVTHHAWRNWATSQQRQPAGSGDSGIREHLLTVPAREDLVHRLEQEFDRELLEMASARVRLRVAPHNWEAFRLTTLEGVPVEEAAQQLHMKIANIYAAKSRVQKLLREETERMEQATGGDGG